MELLSGVLRQPRSPEGSSNVTRATTKWHTWSRGIELDYCITSYLHMKSSRGKQPQTVWRLIPPPPQVPDRPPLRDLSVTLVLGMWEIAAQGNHGLNLGNWHETKFCLSPNSIPLSLLSTRLMSFFAGWNRSFSSGEPNSTLEILTWSSLWAVGPAEPGLHPLFYPNGL